MGKAAETSPQLVVAISKYFDGDQSLVKGARAECAPGEHDVLGAIQLAGKLKVGEPYESRPSPRLVGAHVATTFVALLVVDGILRKQEALALATRVMELALQQPLSEEELAKSEDEVVLELVRTKAQVAKRIAELLPREKRNGQVNFRGLAEGLAPSKEFARARL